MTPPIPTPPVEPEVKAARVNSVGALGAAIIALVAAIIGALIAAGITSSTADKQIAASQSQASADFLRAQRQSAYSQFLLDTQDLGELLNRGDRVDDAILNIDVSRLDWGKIDAGQIKLLATRSNVQLIGTPATVDAAERVHSALLAVYANTKGGFSGDNLSANGNDYFLTYQSNLAKYEAARQDFLNAARSDLGGERVEFPK